MRKEMKIGLSLNALFLALNCLGQVPHLLLGILAGIGWSMIAVGALSEGAYRKLAALKGR